MSSQKRVELLAPAGSVESFYGSILAGADAVYLAGSRFGARAYADNFTEEELVKCIRFARLYHRKVYLTVNTLIKEEEYGELVDYLRPYYVAGLHGVIVQDFGILSLLRRHFPEMELHASTQMTITGSDGASLMAKEGICRVVPARELSLQEIKAIKKDTGLELECFIHGAMCYSYSGQCLFSSFLGGRSGNRGRCAQPCRLSYEHDGQTDYPLSMKDMCTASVLQDLIEAGIDSFKIEGRMKRPEYAAGVTSIYRKVIDSYYENGSCQISKEDRQTLRELYVRSQLSEGYYYCHNSQKLIAKDNPAYAVTKDSLLEYINEKYILNGADRMEKLPLYMKAYFSVGEVAYLELGLMNSPICVYAYGEVVSEAQNRPLEEADIKKCLKKLGGTVFCLEDKDCSIELQGQVFYSLKMINELRRDAIEQLLEQLVPQREAVPIQDTKLLGIDTMTHLSDNNKVNESICILVRKIDQLEAALDTEPRDVRIYIEESLLIHSFEQVLQLCRPALSRFDSVRFFIAGVRVRRNRHKESLDALMNRIATDAEGVFSGFLVRNLEDLAFVVQYKDMHLMDSAFENFVMIADYGLYSWNYEAQAFLMRYCDEITLPLEPSGMEQKKLAKHYHMQYGKKIEKLVYGRIPMMVSAGCVRKTGGLCKSNGETEFIYMTDRKGAKLPVLIDCLHCQNEIFNAEVLSLHRILDTYKQDCTFRLELTDENRSQVQDILNYFLKLRTQGFIFQKNSLDPVKNYTTGHEKHGVE